MLRQGDVLLVSVASLPPGASLESTGRPVILAYGEVTGHTHRVEAPGAKLYQDRDGATYLVFTAPGRVVHEEHDPIDLGAGTYQVIRQRTYEPGEIRFVAD